jgi:signal transduction histidine kinase
MESLRGAAADPQPLSAEAGSAEPNTQLLSREGGREQSLAAEAVAVKIRWFGLVVGILLVNFGSPVADTTPLNAILFLGFIYTALDTGYFLSRRVFLQDHPLVIAAMEALFIGLLCHFETGLDSPFRYFYLLSLLCCAIRNRATITAIACAFDCVSYGVLFVSLPAGARDVKLLAMMLVVMVWVAWAAIALSRLLKLSGERLAELNAGLERRIAERTLELEIAQAQVLHQEKMAGFGLLAAGIAHEVGNPLTSISNLVQMLERRELDDYSGEKLGQVNGQLQRIQSILRELVTFSRPASDERGQVALKDVVDEALGIAKFYKGGKNREITASLPATLPAITGVRDQLVQVVFNLVLNSIDATDKGGRIAVRGLRDNQSVVLEVEDNGVGIPQELKDRIFQPYFTTKRQGTGLGLFVTLKIVVDHGGRMMVDSEPGKGTTFRVVLPIAA